MLHHHLQDIQESRNDLVDSSWLEQILNDLNGYNLGNVKTFNMIHFWNYVFATNSLLCCNNRLPYLLARHLRTLNNSPSSLVL